MKKYFYIATIAAFMLSGCEDFLDTENYTKKNTGNFPETVEDIIDVINMTGYENASHCYKVFKEKYNMSIKEYRDLNS